MGLEAGSYISDLNIANPAGADLKQQGDDHIRLIKTLLKATFPSADHAIYLERPVVALASAATTDLGAQTSNYISVTGVVTITSLGTVASGVWKFVTFAGALTLTHAAGLLLPGAANITTAVNDRMLAMSLGSGNWIVLSYQRADGTPVGGFSISALTADATPDVTADYMATYDASATGNKKVLLSVLFALVNGLTADASPDPAADYFLSYDASAAAAKKVLLTNIYKAINSLTEDTSPDYANDLVQTYDTSATAAKKVKLQTLALGVPHVILESQQVSGTSEGLSSGADRTRTLNTEVLDTLGINSLASNQFTLPAGTYYIEWSAPAYRADANQSMLYDVTGGAVLKRGTSQFNANSDPASTSRSDGRHLVTIAGSNVFEIRHRVGGGSSTNGGLASSFGTETYTWVKIWKLA